MPEGPDEGRPEVAEGDEELLAKCRVDTFRSGGKGGQHQNKRNSGVRLTHLPTGVVVTARASRSQLRNKRAALRDLREELERRNRPPRRRVPTEVPPSEKRRRRKMKRRRSLLKRSRRRPRSDDPGNGGG